ncbi:hypothetical protein Tco_0365664 [Tanacetum coccineum]
MPLGGVCTYFSPPGVIPGHDALTIAKMPLTEQRDVGYVRALTAFEHRKNDLSLMEVNFEGQLPGTGSQGKRTRGFSIT